jgi:cytochrome c peroxidase
VKTTPRNVLSSRPQGVLRRSRIVLALGLMLGPASCGYTSDAWFCDGAGFDFSTLEWERLGALANPGPPPADLSNAVETNALAQNLGRAFYFDTRFSGNATQVDALRRPAAIARAPQGQPASVSCASCHDLGAMGADIASLPGNVSSGAGWTDVNALATVNSAYQRLFFWNGRVDSLWALAAAVAESATTMNGNRLHTAWVIADFYQADYNQVFTPLGVGLPPALLAGSCQVTPLVETGGPRAGQCKLDAAGGCPPPCRSVVGDDQVTSGCWPRFPLNGKPSASGAKGCQPGATNEPFGDAWDCMDPKDRDAITRVLVNWSKALAAFERRLVSVDASFDRFVRAGPASDEISPAARRGARLFVGKAGCSDCHATAMLSDQAFHNIGVAQVGPNVPTLAECPAGGVCDCTGAGKNCLPWGAYDGAQKLKSSPWLRSLPWSDSPTDPSRAADVALVPGDDLKGAWRTPSLRNVALTAPYMHDGRYATLDEVIAHYARGGDIDAVGTRAVQIKPLLLSDGEQADLVAFLRTLTGPPVDPTVTTNLTLPTRSVCP